MDEPRSGETRARAETALVRLLHELRDDEPFLVVLGGLVPEVLARDAGTVVPEHLGTTDVDVLLITHVETDADLASVERALDRLDFEPDPEQDGWRWRGPVEGWTGHVARDFEWEELRGRLRSTFLEVRERYRLPGDTGPRSYAEQAMLVDPGADEALLRADAVDTVQRFFAALGL